jgi:hypothetical protein
MDTDGVKGKWKIIIIMASGRCVCVWKSTEKYGARRMENGEWSERDCRFLSEDCHSRPKITGEMVVAAP